MDVSMELNRYYDFWIGMDAVYEKWAKMHNLTVNAVFTLYILTEAPQVSQSLICEKLILPKQTVNAVLDSLIKSGYVDKKASEVDKRSKFVSLTEEGQIFAKQVIKELDNFETTALSKMTFEQRNSMIKNSQIYLKHLSDDLNRII